MDFGVKELRTFKNFHMSQRKNAEKPGSVASGRSGTAKNSENQAVTPPRSKNEETPQRHHAKGDSARSRSSPSATGHEEAQEIEVKVFLRSRPLLESEERANFDIRDNMVIARPVTKRESEKHFAERTYTFTSVFNDDAPQQVIFDEVAVPLLKKFVKGIDVLLFAYGATSAGKTFTVKGTDEEPGLLPRMVESLLTKPPPKNIERGLLVSCVEVYNERVHDLLGDPNKPLRLGRDPFGYTSVKGLNEIELAKVSDLHDVLSTIEQVRKSTSTSLNSSSSRSHCIFMLKLVTIPLDPHTGQRTSDFSQIKCTRLSIVDLAGSERVSTTEDVNSKTISEACNINKSMLVLGKCIREIRRANAGVSAQIPFRESKLTELFRDFFESGKGRNVSCAIIINISPAVKQFDDTLFSLQFAAEAVECHVRDKDCDDDVCEETEESVEEAATVDMRTLQLAELRIREDIQAEMSERLRRIQSEYQEQLEQIRLQSQQPYTSKLQQALALKMQSEAQNRELEEMQAERDRERQRAQELKVKFDALKKQLDDSKAQLDEVVSKNASLEGNIQKMMEATKLLHQKQMGTQRGLEDRINKIDVAYRSRVEQLESQIAALK